MQRSIRNNNKQLYTNKTDNLEEMEKFLEKYNFPRLNQEESLNHWIKNIWTNKSQVLKLKQWFKKSQQTKVQDQKTLQVNFINI